MARTRVQDPQGQLWRVWRRWYAWRRLVTFRDVWIALPGTSSDRYGDDTDLVGGFTFVIAMIGLVVSTVDFVVQVVVLPFVSLARLLGMASWPVQLDRSEKYIRTERVKGAAAALQLRDALAEQVRSGSLPDWPAPEQRPDLGSIPPAAQPPVSFGGVVPSAPTPTFAAQSGQLSEPGAGRPAQGGSTAPTPGRPQPRRAAPPA